MVSLMMGLTVFENDSYDFNADQCLFQQLNLSTYRLSLLPAVLKICRSKNLNSHAGRIEVRQKTFYFDILPCGKEENKYGKKVCPVGKKLDQLDVNKHLLLILNP